MHPKKLNKHGHNTKLVNSNERYPESFAQSLTGANYKNMLWSQRHALPGCLQLSFVPYCLVRFVANINDKRYAIPEGGNIAMDGHPVQHAGHDRILLSLARV